MTVEKWGADVKISMPEVNEEAARAVIPMNGFAFSLGGIRHDITAADLDEILAARYGPPL